LAPSVRARFAPSPTGDLHLGGARTALFNYLFARHHGGRLLLRIEDTDRQRSRREHEERILEDLGWLGLRFDEGPYRQSERGEVYAGYAGRLLEGGLAYEAEDASGRRAVYFRPPERGGAFRDALRGEVRFGGVRDFVILKSDGMPAYNFAAVVDDIEMEITHVIRGDDHISNTPRQIMIHRALGHELPAFAHVPQVLGPDRKKLSKRHGAASVEDFAEQGILPEALFNYLALLGAGYAADEEIFAPEELAERFRLEKVSGNPAVFDEQKLLAINAVYIRRKSPEELAMLAAPMLSERGVADAGELERDMPRLVRIMELLRERLQRTTDIPEAAGYFYGERLDYDREQFEKQFGKEFVRENLPELYRRLKALPEWTADAIESCVRGLAAEKEKGARHLIHPLRFATTGRTVSAGLFETMELIGRERCLLRIADVLERLQSPERSL